MGSTWPSNGSSYNWDAGLICSWNVGLSSAFSHWGDAGRRSRAPRLGAVVVLKCRHRAQHFGIAMMLRHRPQALHLGTAVMSETRASMRRGLRTSHLDTTSMAMIIIAFEVWTLLSDDSSSVIFRQFTVICLHVWWLNIVINHRPMCSWWPEINHHRWGLEWEHIWLWYWLHVLFW